jgi:hypothetical protein
MSEFTPAEPGGQPPETRSEPIQHHPATARVPERVARGSFASAVSVFGGPNEFVIDFLQGLARPPQLAARIVVNPITMEQFVVALRENLNRYTTTYGAPPPMPKPPQGARQPGIQEIYQDLKIADDQLSGAYANAVLIGHSPAEFNLDFITSFYPHAAVASRVYIAAGRLPGVLDTLASALANHRRQRGQGGPGQPPGPAGPGGPPGIPGLYPPTPPRPEGP